MARKKRKIKPIKPAPYTGLRMPTPVQRNTAPQYGGSSTSISQGGMAEPQEQSGGGLESLMAGKEAYDQMGEMYQSGEDLQKGILGMPEKAGNAMDWMGERYDDVAVPISDWWNDTNTLRSIEQLPQGGAGLQYPTASGSSSGISMGVGSSPAQNVANMYGLQGSSPVLGTQMNVGQMGLESMPSHWGSSGQLEQMTPALQDAVMRSGDVSMATQLGPTYETLDGVQVTGQGLQNTGEAAEAAIDATAAEASMLSKAGALAGLGLNAYDMFDQGVTANNAMGLLGSGIMAGTTMLGLSNAWNPVGWGLLGASAIGGLTDWW